jgi:hypothetical protein
VAAEPSDIGIVYFPQDAAAVRAVIRHLVSQAINLSNIAQDSLRDDCLGSHIFGNRFAFARTLVSEFFKQPSHLRDGTQ